MVAVEHQRLIVERYLLREIAYAFVGVMVLLLLIFLSGTFVRILSDAASGAYPADIIFALVGLKSLSNLMLVVPLSFFLAVLLALGRLYNDSEMVVLFACGVGPERVVKSVVKLGLLIGAVVAVLALYAGPWAEEQGHRLLDRAVTRAEIEGIAGGRFNQSQNGEHLLYVEEISDDRRSLTNIFAHTTSREMPNILSAAGAYQVNDPKTGDRFLVLKDGYRYEGTPGSADFRIIRFQEHGVRLQERAVVAGKRRRDAIPSSVLARSDHPSDQAEFQWRVSMPISALILALLAVPLAKTSPRQGRYGKVFAGILLYIIYNNLMTVARAWVVKGVVPPVVGMWWVHLLMLAIVVVLLVRQTGLSFSRSNVRAASA